MLNLKTITAAGLIAAASLSGVSRAANPTLAASEIVEYRLETWKATHVDGTQADKLVKTLKTLRCEVKVGSHGDHTDVKYRCAKWQSLALRDHDVAHQWESWLKKYGFETKHKH